MFVLVALQSRDVEFTIEGEGNWITTASVSVVTDKSEVSEPDIIGVFYEDEFPADISADLIKRNDAGVSFYSVKEDGVEIGCVEVHDIFVG